MSSTNKTPVLDLPQWVDSDKPTFLGDMNVAFSKIDTAVGNNSVALENIQAVADGALTTAQNAVETANTANQNAINAGTSASGASASASEAVSVANNALTVANNTAALAQAQQEEIDNINGNYTAGTRVAIDIYNSSAAHNIEEIIPTETDGYVAVAVGVSGYDGDIWVELIDPKTSLANIRLIDRPTSGHSLTIFVKKGSIIRYRAKDATGNFSCYWIPIVPSNTINN